MTNPDNIVRVRARNGGRASVYEANGWCQAFSTGLLEGNGVVQNTVADMNVLVGGSITKPDVVIATNPAGYKIALDIVGQQAVAITAPASNKRISAIVAYTDDLSLPTTQDTVTGAPGSCGLIVVNGTAASSPTAPNDTTIRSAITADGATGSQASYCVIATMLVASGTTAITNSEITMQKAGVMSQNIDFATSTETLTFSIDAGVTTGTGDATLILLDNNGLTMLIYNGTTGYNDSGTGTRILKWDLAKPFTSVYGGSVNSYYTGNTEAYMSYNSITNTGKGECYVVKTSQATQKRMLSLTIIGIME